MARKKKKSSANNRGKAISIFIMLIGLLLLLALVTHHYRDDARIAEGPNPFELQYLNQGGMLGAYISYFSLSLLGWLAYFIPLGLILVGLRLFPVLPKPKLEFNSFLLFVVSLVGTMMYNVHIAATRDLDMVTDYAGGYTAEQLTILSVKLVGPLGSYIALSGLIVILLTLYTSITPMLAVRIKLPGTGGLKKAYQFIAGPMGKLFSFQWMGTGSGSSDAEDELETAIESEEQSAPIQTEPELPLEEYEPEPSEDSQEEETNRPARRTTKPVKPAPKVQVGSFDYTYPQSDLLAENPQSASSVDRDELGFTARMLKETLETFGVRVEGDIEAFPGPVITRYEFKPGTGIKVNQILSLSDDLALALKAKRIRIIAPIPGKAAVGIEIPNRNPQMVYLRDIITSKAFANEGLVLPLALGKSTAGVPFTVDLTKMPHLLIAGATGSGKSVCVNVIITSLLYRLHPHQVRFIFIDPKMLELSVYAGIPHLGRPVVTNPKRAEKVLADAVVEMEARYRKLANASVRNIADYNKKAQEEEDKLPYIVVIVDELADLMMSTTSSKVELLITRLAQMSRAVGIHLILATQRPSVDVITGLIKANFPARIAFQVSSKVDSRTIIDGNGAEKLLGNGDMLFLAPGQPEAVRIHGANLSSHESNAIITSILDQGLPMLSLENISQAEGETTETEMDLSDPLFKEACEVVVRHKQGSVSLLQRRLGVGYQRAARLIDKLEQAGIVTPFDGSKARDVLVDKPYLDSLFAPGATPPPVQNSETN